MKTKREKSMILIMGLFTIALIIFLMALSSCEKPNESHEDYLLTKIVILDSYCDNVSTTDYHVMSIEGNDTVRLYHHVVGNNESYKIYYKLYDKDYRIFIKSTSGSWYTDTIEISVEDTGSGFKAYQVLKNGSSTVFCQYGGLLSLTFFRYSGSKICSYNDGFYPQIR